MPRPLPRPGRCFRQFTLAGLLVVTTGLLSPALHAQTRLGSMAVEISGGATGSCTSTPFTLSGHLEFTDVIFDPPVFQIALANGREFTSADAGFMFAIHSRSFDSVRNPGWTDHEFNRTMAVHGPSAIPEPSTYAALAGFGTLGLAEWQRRAKRHEPASV